MEVNWDEIDKKYVEVPINAPAGSFGYSPQLTDDPNTVFEHIAFTHHSPMLAHVTINPPYALDVEFPSSASRAHFLQKPDGV